MSDGHITRERAYFPSVIARYGVSVPREVGFSDEDEMVIFRDHVLISHRLLLDMAQGRYTSGMRMRLLIALKYALTPATLWPIIELQARVR